MKVAVMQPYAFPYLGYFQLAGACDRFVLLDDVSFNRQGWINRNRILAENGRPAWITIPVEDASCHRRILDTRIAGQPVRWREKLLRRLRQTYGRAPHFARTWQFLEPLLSDGETNLAAFLRRSLEATFRQLGIATDVRSSSADFPADPAEPLQGAARVIDICRRAGADVYVNAEGGRPLYGPGDFAAHGLRLAFLEHVPLPYRQHAAPFVPRLSVIDALMNCAASELRELLASYRLDEVT